MSHAYHDSDERRITSFKRIHGNGEETHVHILTAGERYAVVAVDLDPREYVAVASEALGYEPTKESAQERAQAWMEQNPKGVAASGGKGNLIIRAIKKLNDYGNDLQQQQSDDNA